MSNKELYRELEDIEYEYLAHQISEKTARRRLKRLMLSNEEIEMILGVEKDNGQGKG